MHDLSTFLGHANPQSTAVYLTITSELFAEANRCFAAPAPTPTEATVDASPNRRIFVYGILSRLPAPAEGAEVSLIRSYRDTLRLFLVAVVEETKQGISALRLEQLSFERVAGYLRDLEQIRHTGSRRATSA